MADLRRVLRYSFVYRALQTVIGGRRARARYIDEHVRPQAGDRILDIGCGPGDILDFLPDVDYVGVDVNPQYIASAQTHYGSRGRFLCLSVNAFELPEPGTYDLVLVNGVLHHLTDAEVQRVCHLACQALRPDGFFISLDGCYTPGQSRIAKLLLDWDRGQFVRTQEAYEHLIAPYFKQLQSTIEDRYFHIPYTLLILRAGSPHVTT